MGSRAAPKGTISDVTDAGPASRKYEFYALADGLRIPLAVDGICSCDAEAGLVALALTTPSIGVEVECEGMLIYQAPCRGSAHAGLAEGHA